MRATLPLQGWNAFLRAQVTTRCQAWSKEARTGLTAQALSASPTASHVAFDYPMASHRSHAVSPCGFVVKKGSRTPTGAPLPTPESSISMSKVSAANEVASRWLAHHRRHHLGDPEVDPHIEHMPKINWRNVFNCAARTAEFSESYLGPANG